MTFKCAITHQKHLAQSGRSTRSAVDTFNTLRVFTKEPIREQKIKLECMNVRLTCPIFSKYSINVKFTVALKMPTEDLIDIQLFCADTERMTTIWSSVLYKKEIKLLWIFNNNNNNNICICIAPLPKDTKRCRLYIITPSGNRHNHLASPRTICNWPSARPINT